MSIENRDLAVGTKLVGRHRKTEHSCEVVQTDEGIRYKLTDGSLHKSPSSAAKAVMNGVSANGWRFWSLAGELVDSVEDTRPANPAKPTRSIRQIKRLPNQKGVPEGQTKWFCSACMESFLVEAAKQPEACPKGHPAQVEERARAPRLTSHLRQHRRSQRAPSGARPRSCRYPLPLPAKVASGGPARL